MDKFAVSTQSGVSPSSVSRHESRWAVRWWRSASRSQPRSVASPMRMFSVCSLWRRRGAYSLVVRNCEQVSTRSHAQGPSLGKAQAVAEFEFGFEEVCLQPMHRLGIEVVFAQCPSRWPGECDVWADVSVEGVLVLLFDCRVGQAGVDQRHGWSAVPEDGHDCLRARSAFGELCPDGVTEATGGDRVARPWESTSPAAVHATLSPLSNRCALDSNRPRTMKMC